MSLEYDEEVLELQAIEAGELSKTGMFQGTVKTGIVGYANSKLIEGDGVLFTATFKILTNVAGEYEVAIDLDAIGVTKDDVIDATTQAGSVTVEHVHSFGDWTETKKPSCEGKGEETRTCSVCGEKKTRPVAATGHRYGDWTETKQPTCEEEGEETRTCACGKTETRPVVTTGHVFGEWTLTKQPTCEEEGEETRTCACGKTETRAILTTGHVFGEWTVTKQPTCEEEGEESCACACGKTETRPIAATGHNFGDWEVTKEPKEGVAGEETRKCTGCSEAETRPIEALSKEGCENIVPIIILVACGLVIAGGIVIYIKRDAIKLMYYRLFKR